MPTVAAPRTRSAVGIALSILGVLALATALFAPAAGAGNHDFDDPPGNNGTVKIDGVPLDPGPGDDGPGHRDNEPQLECEPFAVDFYQFDQSTEERDLYATVQFQAWPPTGDRQTLIPVTTTPAYTPTDGTPALDGARVYIGEDEAGDADDLDASILYELDFEGIEPHPQQGYHVKLTVHADSVREGPQADVKHKVFWIGPCEEGPGGDSETGSLTVTKTVVDATTTQAFEFEVDCDDDAFDDTFSLRHGETHTIEDIPVDTECTVTEDAVAGYTTTVVPSTGTVVIDEDGETVAFRNTATSSGGDIGALTVTKTVVNGDVNRAFVFRVDCDGDGFDQSFPLKHGESRTIASIPVGTECTVTEDAAAGYTTTVSPTTGSVVIDLDGETVGFTNRVPVTEIETETEVGGEVIEKVPTQPQGGGVPLAPAAPEVVEAAPVVLGSQVTRPAAQVRSAQLARTGPSQVPMLVALAGFALLVGGAMVLLEGRLDGRRRRMTV